MSLAQAGISLIQVLCTFLEEEKDALVQKHQKDKF